MGFLTDPILRHAPTRACLDDSALIAAMLRVEGALAQVQARAGIIPADAAQAIAALAGHPPVTPEILAQGVADAGVPVPALVAALRKALPPDAADWVHWGATSQDIVDTALCLCYGAALDLLAAQMGALIDDLHRLSLDHAATPLMARTRGQLATPITLGLRVAHWAQPLVALESDLGAVRAAALRVQLGGASGSADALGEQAAALASALAEALGLADAAPWHTDRGGIARLAGWLVGTVAACAKIGRDLALSSRGEIAEMRPARAGGSSAMPHKANPVGAEALQTLLPLALGAQAALTAAAAHAEERDGACWPVEWAVMPGLMETAGAALAHARALLDGLAVDVPALRARIIQTPEALSEAAVQALSPHLGRAAALRLVAEALGSDLPLPTALARHPGAPAGLDWDALLSDARFAESSARAAARVFAMRGTRT